MYDMKKYTRFLCIVAAFLMVLCSVSCADENNQNTNETTPSTVDTSNNDSEVDENRDYISDVSGSLKFNGREIRMIGLQKAGVEDELYSEIAHSSDIVADAIYARNLAISERLGITIRVEMVEDVATDAETSVKTGGSDAYQVYTDQTNTACLTMTKNYLYNLGEIENLNLEKKYWSAGFSDIASYGISNKQYLATGAPALSLYRYTYVTVYNKDYFKDAGWTDLYEVTNNKEWTLDYQFSLIQDVHTELDGSTGITEGDFVGFVSGDTVSVDPYLTACGIHIIKKNKKDGTWEMDSSTMERVSVLVDKLQDIYYNANGAYIYSSASFDDTGLTYIADKFAAQEAAMATVQLHALELTSKNMEFMYGIVPMPKFSKEQDRYYSYVQDQVTSFGILSNVPEKDLPMIGAFLDLFAYESYIKVVPEFYGKTLSYKMLKDQESLDMLHLIYETTEFDFVGAFSAMLPIAIRDQMRVQVASKSNRVSSSFAQWSRQTGKKLGKIFEKLDK